MSNFYNMNFLMLKISSIPQEKEQQIFNTEMSLSQPFCISSFDLANRMKFKDVLKTYFALSFIFTNHLVTCLSEHIFTGGLSHTHTRTRIRTRTHTYSALHILELIANLDWTVKQQFLSSNFYLSTPHLHDYASARFLSNHKMLMEYLPC